MSLPNADEIKGKWKQQIGAAKVAWGKLTEDELLKLEGHQQKLAGLIQVRYAITRDEAEKRKEGQRPGLRDLSPARRRHELVA